MKNLLVTAQIAKQLIAGVPWTFWAQGIKLEWEQTEQLIVISFLEWRKNKKNYPCHAAKAGDETPCPITWIKWIGKIYTRGN